MGDDQLLGGIWSKLRLSHLQEWVDLSTIERISGPSSSVPELDVVFLHGLDGDPVKTRSYGPKQSFWPQWLTEDDPAAAVWCIGFDASASHWRGAPMGILDRSVNLLALLQTRGIGKRPLCLIGHSLGGLMAKQMLLQAAAIGPEYQELATHTKCVIFLGTPHDGASIARIVKIFGILRPIELLGDLVNDGPGLRQLNTWYRNWAPQHGVQYLVFFEKGRIARHLIVAESSVDPGLPAVTPIGIDADHVHICKPAAREDLVYAHVNTFVAGLIRRPPTQGQAPQDVRLGASGVSDDQAIRLERYKGVFCGSGWSATLRRLYPWFPLLEFAGAEFPIWVGVAASTEWDRLDSAVGQLADGEDSGQESYPAQLEDHSVGSDCDRARREAASRTWHCKLCQLEYSFDRYQVFRIWGTG